MKTRMILVLIMVFAVTTPVWATTFDINFNDDSAQAQVDLTLNRDQYGSSSFNGRFLYNDNDDTELGSIGLRFRGEPGNVPGLDLGVGAQMYGGNAGEINSVDIGGIGVGGLFGYAPPHLNGLGFDGRLVYVPEVFSFFDTERVVEAALRMFFAITPRIKIHAEYQNIGIKIEDRSGTHTIDEEVRFGFTGRF
ncbi:MAG: YfaZ family outer membrane protein [Desulfuromonadales bacterium]